MSKHNLFSRIILSALLIGLLLGAGVGWALAERPKKPSLSSPGGEEPQLQPEVSGSQFYKRVAGYSFRPVHYATTFLVSDSACLWRADDSGYASFNYDLHLPDGAEVTQLTLYYYDNRVIDNLTLELKANDGFGNGPTIASLASSGWQAQFRSVDSGPISYVVDNFEEVLALRVTIPDGGAGSGLRICRVRVGYQYNPTAISLPLILNHTN